MKYMSVFLLAFATLIPVVSNAFDLETNMELKPDLQRYSDWCYIQFNYNHRGLPSNQIKSQMSTAIITLPKHVRGVQFSWYSPDPVTKNSQTLPYAAIDTSSLPERHHDKLLMLQNIAYWDTAWKLFIGFDVGVIGTLPAPGSLRACDAMQFTPHA